MEEFLQEYFLINLGAPETATISQCDLNSILRKVPRPKVAAVSEL
jgi:hypothetical protein